MMMTSECQVNCADLNQTVFDTISLLNQVNDLEHEVYAEVDSGATAWMLFATQLVLLLTIPGLLLFYAGQTKFGSVLTVCLYFLTAVGLVTVEWFAYGYSFAYGPVGDEFKGKAGYQWYGDASRVWVRGMKLDTINDSAPQIPEAQFLFYELTLAILAVCIIIGGVINRLKFTAFVVFQLLWIPIVYCPLAHQFRHHEGFWNKLGASDGAGALVVFVPAGITALCAAFFVGPSLAWKPARDTMKPHNIFYVLLGAALMWVGFLGLTGGAQHNAGLRTAYGVFTTQIAASSSSLMWLACETIMKGKPSVFGLVKGALAGLVAISACTGDVDITGAFFIGFFAGPCCLFSTAVKDVLSVDETLDAFAIFAFGGMVGAIADGFYAMDVISKDRLIQGAFAASTRHGGHFLAYQLAATCYTFAYSLLMSSILLMIVEFVVGLRVTEDEETIGLDYYVTYEQLPDSVERAMFVDIMPDLLSQSSTYELPREKTMTRAYSGIRQSMVQIGVKGEASMEEDELEDSPSKRNSNSPMPKLIRTESSSPALVRKGSIHVE
jgi:Amt family ammonium transporter